MLQLAIWNRLSVDTRRRIEASHPLLSRLFGSATTPSCINSTNYQCARLLWEATTQRQALSGVLDDLAHQRPNSLQKQLGLQLDKNTGLIHCYGRLTNADLPSTAIHPILLPKDHHFTTLVISDIHQRHLHVGVSHTLARVRLRYWIPHGHARVRTV